MVAGGLLWFTVIWGRKSDGDYWKKVGGFWRDQNDEVLVSLIFGLIFLVWDDEAIYAFFYLKDVVMGGQDSDTWTPEITELRPFMYLILMPIGEIIYSKLTK